jgi:hypothetical protein
MRRQCLVRRRFRCPQFLDHQTQHGPGAAWAKKNHFLEQRHMGGNQRVAVHSAEEIVNGHMPPKSLGLDDRPQNLRQLEGVGQLLQALSVIGSNVRQIDIALRLDAGPGAHVALDVPGRAVGRFEAMHWRTA